MRTNGVDQLPSATTTASACIGWPPTTAPVTASPSVIRPSIERLYEELHAERFGHGCQAAG